MLEKLSFQIKQSQIHPTKYVKVVFFAIIYKWNYFHCIFFWFCRHMIIGQHLLTNISSRLDINKMLLCLFFKLQMSLEMMKPFTHRVEHAFWGHMLVNVNPLQTVYHNSLFRYQKSRNSEHPLICYYIQERFKWLRLRDFIFIS